MILNMFTFPKKVLDQAIYLGIKIFVWFDPVITS